MLLVTFYSGERKFDLSRNRYTISVNLSTENLVNAKGDPNQWLETIGTCCKMRRPLSRSALNVNFGAPRK